MCISDVNVAKGLESNAEFQKKFFGLEDVGVCFVKCNVADKDDWKDLLESAEKFSKIYYF